MKYWFTTSLPDGGYREDAAWLALMSDRVLASGNPRYRPACSAAEADVIVFFEPGYFKNRKYVQMLSSHPIIREDPNKCFVLDYDDHPFGFLPGVYGSMKRSQMDIHRHRAGGYMGQYNLLTTELADQRHQEPRLLFSFRGAASSEVRKCLFQANITDERSRITQVFQWFNHTEAEKRAYVEEMLDSKFVLCPCGLGTQFIRLFETMELGRVPVILSDEWVAPEGPSWSQFSLRISESRIHELPALLREYEQYAGEMGTLARQAWEDWFSPGVRVAHMLTSIEDIIRRRPADHDEAKYQKEWLSLHYAWTQGWTPLQSAYRNVRQGTLTSKIKTKVHARLNPDTKGSQA